MLCGICLCSSLVLACCSPHVPAAHSILSLGLFWVLTSKRSSLTTIIISGFPILIYFFVVPLSLYTCTSIDGFIIFGYSLSSPQEYKLQGAGVLSVSFTGVSSMPLTVFIAYLVNEKGIFVDKIMFLKAPILLPTLEALIGIWGARALPDKGMEGWICVLPSW